MRILLGLLVLAFLSGCVAPGFEKLYPGYTHETISEFDHHRRLSMNPAPVYTRDMQRADLNIGLLWTEASPAIFFIEAQANFLASIPAKDSLQFNIDGEIVTLSSLDERTTFSASPSQYYEGLSSRAYPTKREFIDKLLSAKNVIVRLQTEKGHAEGIFSQDAEHSARPSFRAFLQKAPIAGKH